MTKLGQEFISHPPTINRPEFLRFVDSSLREKQIAFLILDSAENYQNYQKDILSLTSDCIKLHLFFFISGDDSKILLYRPNSALLSQLEELGYRYVIFIRSGFLVKCERAVDSLITESLLHPEILFIHHSHPNLSNQIFLATVGSGRGALIDQHLIERPIGVVSYSLPHRFLPISENSFVSHPISISAESIADSIVAEKNEITQHLKEGFSCTFVFNTESYNHLTDIRFTNQDVQLVGFASGFKLNYISHLYKNNIKKISFVDSNLNSLELKKDMIQSWDGSDLPSWFFNYWKNRFPIYEKTPSFFAECWNRELSLWGGEDRFKKHWAWFREQEITFHFFDAIKEKDKFESVFDKDKTILFWASNLWHNEYVSFQIGLAHMYDAHQLWLRSLASSTNQDIVFLQDKIFTSSGWIQPNRKNLKTLLQKIN